MPVCSRCSGHDARGKGALALAAGLYIAAWGFGTSAMYPVAVGLMAAPAAGLAVGAPDGAAEPSCAGAPAIASWSRAAGCWWRSRCEPRAGCCPRGQRCVERVGGLGERDAAAAPVAATRCAAATPSTPRPAAATRWTPPSWCIDDPAGAGRGTDARSSAPTRCWCTRASTSWTACSPTPAARAATRAGRCCIAPPDTTCTRSATSSRARACAACTGAPPPSAAS